MANVISDETIEYVGILAKLELSESEKEDAKKDMASVALLPSPLVTTSSLITLLTGNTCDIGSTPVVSSSPSLSI